MQLITMWKLDLSEENLKSFSVQKQQFGAAFAGFKAPNDVKPSGNPLQTEFFNQPQPIQNADQQTNQHKPLLKFNK